MSTQKTSIRHALFATVALIGISLPFAKLSCTTALADTFVPGTTSTSNQNAPGGSGTMVNPNPPSPPSFPPGVVAHPSVIERYTFSYRLNNFALPLVYIGTGYTLAGTYTVGQAISVPWISGMVNATVIAVDDTIPFDAQLLNRPIQTTVQYQRNNPRYFQ